MDNHSSWTKGLAHKSDKSPSTPQQSTNQSSYEFLDLSDISWSKMDEKQKLKLKLTLEKPTITTIPRDPKRSNFMTRNLSIKSQHYDFNNYVKTQRNYHLQPSKFPNTLEHHEPHNFSSSEGNNFSSNKINSNFSNQVSNNLTDRSFSNTQDKISKWHNKKSSVAIKESEIVKSREISSKRSIGEKDRHFQNQPAKEFSREPGKFFNKNTMTPPPPPFQTATTSATSSSTSNQVNVVPHFQYGSHQQQMYPQMYSSHHMDHQMNQNTSRGGGMGRRRSRGGNNSNRREFQNSRQHNHQQSQQADYNQMVDQNQQGAVINPATQYQPFYIHHYPPWQNPLPQNLNLTQNLTGQPLFAIQQPLVYQYGSPYPIMYNLMPQTHPMPHHQQPELVENDIQEPSIPWQAHQPIYHHSPLLSNEFTHHEEYQIMETNDFQQEEIDPEITFVGDENEEELYDDKDNEIIEKTRDLMIQTTPPIEDEESGQLEVRTLTHENENSAVNCVMNQDPESVPNVSAHQKKQTASVSVSAIPNQDVQQPENASSEVLESKISFSSITAASNPKNSTTPNDHIKTESNQNEMQQTVLIERAKQQIVTTIIGSNKENEKVIENFTADEKVDKEVVNNEKTAQTKSTASNMPPSPVSSRATWAGLFNSKPKPSPQHQQNNVHSIEPQKSLTSSSNSENSTQQEIQNTPNGTQVPTIMSYSAVSAQSIAKSHSPQQTVGSVKNLPQKKNLANNVNVDENKNRINCNQLDQHSMKLGDFFSNYKIESTSIAIRPRGLLNKSNYCYINAILQALISCPPFYHLMNAIPKMPSSYKSHTKTPVTDAMVELVSNYSLMPYRKWSPREKGRKDEVPDIARDSAFEPSIILKMLQTLRTDMFPVEGRQEDAEEFLSFILNRMNDEMIEAKKLVEKPNEKDGENGDDVNGNVENNVEDEDEWQVISGTRNKSIITRNTDFGRSPISDIFGGKLKVRVHREGDHSSDNIEPFFTLKLVIEKASSVREALEILVGRDILEGVLGRTNQEVPAWQQVMLEELPVVLILHLKCFDFKNGCTKILKTVEFPIELKLDQKLIASKNKYQQKQKQYKLFAVVYHDGKEASKGHYITDVFHLSYSSWIRYDDSSVKAIPESNVLHPKSPRVPYLLFYRRSDTTGHKNSTK